MNVHLCNCNFDVLICMQLCDHYLDTIMFQIFMVTNLDTGKFQFKTSWKMFTQRGEVCSRYEHENVVFNYTMLL